MTEPADSGAAAVSSEVQRVLNRGRELGVLHGGREGGQGATSARDADTESLLAKVRAHFRPGEVSEIDALVTDLEDELRLRQAARTLRSGRR